MERIAMGPDGIEVSRLCLGAMALGGVQDEATSFAILDRFVELGGTFIDTANCYMFWIPGGTGDESELLLGRWLASRGNRDDLVIATKVGRRPSFPGGGLEHSEPLTPERIEAGLEESLQRLGTDRVDLFWAHRDDRDTPLETTVAGFDAVVRAGKARMVGASNYTAWRVERARAIAAATGAAAYTAMQNRYSYLQPRPDTVLPEGGHVHAAATDLDYVDQTPGMALLAYSSLLSGAYTNPAKPLGAHYAHPGTDARLQALDAVAAQTGATRNQVVLAWLAGQAAPVVPLVGVSSVAQLEEVAAGLDLKLDAEQWQRLTDAA
ncbi:aldo/keto reductase [Glycomyces sp. TRM65418]|uniref:aldo/keto reductase n=1 Tax=Glycomyces sp. TRM65418 TaxID=2867006 RepID=UPI001CE68BA5|nr:aldo/keto reductase [Glycomyces sp. TRM65418]MCC3763271.1 aldo/keto reductase [Glycomyces sp. TRM65418]QZD57271.1 aldo/keto reductase [Glycomyces sp. TRM65418]